MKQELQQKLYDKYPKIFRQKDLPMTQTCMCWGIDTNDGWYSLLDTLCSQIQWRIDNPPYQRVDCFYNDFADLWGKYISLPISNMLYRPMRKLALLISGEDEETMPKVWAMGEYEKWKNNRPKLTNWLEKQSNEMYIHLSFKPRFEEVKIHQVEATQVKEKLSGLRFYYSGGDDEIRGMVSLAESLSYRICEECGCPGDVSVRGGWYKTLCKDCRKIKTFNGYVLCKRERKNTEQHR
jgi:hypothetical protein